MYDSFFRFLGLVFLTVICACNSGETTDKQPVISNSEEAPKERFKPKLIADHFDFPVGKPDAKRYYNAQPYGENNHLGDDWNGVGGGNTDLGDPIYAIANGYVKFAENYGGGWGNIVRIDHFLPNGDTYESFYAHCDEINTTAGTWVQRGDQIGTIGNNNGMYLAHLHFEIRSDTSLPVGGGYSSYTEGYLDPTQFIKKHR